VKKDPALQFFLFDHGPTPPGRGVQRRLSFPGKVDPYLTVCDLQRAVHFPLDQPELETPRVMFSVLRLSSGIDPDIFFRARGQSFWNSPG
jgi:hypothetical protein